ncbi:MAG: dihydrodipicolinate synthase family protein [Planctomycetes bacterium]|nr:dihydrodipicolinate synthase family protein [Planctomycetota bacterium]
MYLPKGAFAPVPTPLTREDTLDSHALSAHLKWLKSEGLDGALILGTNGEFASSSRDERKLAAETAAKAESGLKLILNVGSCALEDVLDMTEFASDLGYDAVICPPPWYFRDASTRGIADFFLRVLDQSRLPVILYHIPRLTGIPISDELLQIVRKHERCVGVKDSTGDEAEMARLLGWFRDGSYMVGHDRLIAKCLEDGGRGSITACASVIPDLVKSIERKAGQQVKLNSVRGLLEKFGLGPAVKAILRKKGFGDYAARPPLTALPDTQAEQLIAMLNMFGAIKW